MMCQCQHISCCVLDSRCFWIMTRICGQLSNNKLLLRSESSTQLVVQDGLILDSAFKIASKKNICDCRDVILLCDVKVINKLPKPSATRSDVDVAVIDDFTVIFQVPCFRNGVADNMSNYCSCKPARLAMM